MFGKKKYSSLGSVTDVAADIFASMGVEVPQLATQEEISKRNEEYFAAENKRRMMEKAAEEYANAPKVERKPGQADWADESGMRLAREDVSPYSPATIPINAITELSPGPGAYRVVAPPPPPAPIAPAMAPKSISLVAQGRPAPASDISRSGGWGNQTRTVQQRTYDPGIRVDPSLLRVKGVAGVPMEKTYSDLGSALRAMDFDRDDWSIANIRRRNGGRGAKIQEVGRERDGETTFVDATVEYYPDETHIYSETLSKQEAVDQISNQGGDLFPYALPEGLNLETALQQTIETSTQFVNEAQTAMAPAAGGVLEKFNKLDTNSKLAVLAAGYFAVKMLPSKYLYLAAGLLAFNQLKQK